MWHKIDFIHFAHQIFPPVLRGTVMTAFLRTLVVPLCQLHEEYSAFRKKVAQRLYVAANVQSMQKALNDAFFMTDNQIYIDSLEEERPTAFYYKKEEAHPKHIHEKDGNPLYFRRPDENSNKETYEVFVPTFLCTFLDEQAGEYEGKNMQTIKTLLNYYKPAGQSYRITLYDYE